MAGTDVNSMLQLFGLSSGLSAFVILVSPVVVFILPAAIKITKDWLMERRERRSVLLWIEIEAKITRERLLQFNDEFLAATTTVICDHAKKNRPFRIFATISQEANEYKRWRKWIETYPKLLILATAEYIENDLILDGLLKKMDSEEFEKISQERQIKVVAAFVAICTSQKNVCDHLLAQIERQNKG